MRKKPMRWLAAGMALCLTLGAAPAASAAQLPQDAPVFEEIVPYSLYIKNQGCDLMISDRTAFIEGWVSGQTGRSTECEVPGGAPAKIRLLRLDTGGLLDRPPGRDPGICL